MIKFPLLASTIGASVLFSASAFAGSLQPAAGQAPFFNEPAATMTTLQRAEVEAQATSHRPAAGEMNGQAMDEPASMLIRAAVRNGLLQAIASGYHVAAGEATVG